MSYCNDSLIRIFYVAFGAKLSGCRPVIALMALAGIVAGVAFKAWWLLVPASLVLVGSLLAHRLQPSSDKAGTFEGVAVPGQMNLLVPERPAPNQTDKRRQTRMVRIVDQILRRHPHWREARLIKASMLWHFNGDRDGARCHCRDLLGHIQRDDPLFAQVCDLYLHTFNPVPSQSLPTAFEVAVEPGPLEWSTASSMKQANVIPLPSNRLRATPQ